MSKDIDRHSRDMGMRKIRRNMRRAEKIIIDGLEEGLVDAAGQIMEQAIANAPVKTGALVRSAFLTVAPLRKTLGPRVDAGFRVFYAPIVEARLHFLEKAMQEKAPQTLQILRNSAAKRLIVGLRSK